MKKILLTTMIAVASYAAQSQWLNQNVPYGYEGYINDMEAVDANTVWGNPWNAITASPYTRDFVRTIDGGTTWTYGTVSSSPATNLIANIWPIDASTCYVSMYGTTTAGNGVWKTTDGGTTWAEVGANMFTVAGSFPDVVYFWDAQNGMAMGDPTGTPAKYEIYLTADAGATWTQVPGANIPALTNAGEYGITNLFSHADGYIWFATTYGDVYRSIDGGNNWTKSATGFPPYNTGTAEQDISDIAFTDQLNGIVTQVNATAYLLKQTTDGGLTWTDVTPTGNVYANEIDAVPGTNIFVSSGSSTLLGFGTSFSSDNGVTWLDIDAGVSHTAIDFVDANTGFTGEYILAGGPGGAWKFNGALAAIPCGDPSVSSGASTINEVNVCFGDTLFFFTTGAVSPTDGTTHGFGVLVSSCDISGNNDPLNSGCIIGSTGILGSNTTVNLINNGGFPVGTYYLTAVVFGNATGTGQITALTLDPACTSTGQSILANLLDVGDPLCSGLPDECPAAADINNLLGGAVGVVMTSGPWDDTNATLTASDPVAGFECFGEPDGTATGPELNNTLWFTFTGDGNLYFIEAPNDCAGVTDPLDDGDTQIAIYTGTCGALAPAACNEDGPNATGTYYPAGLNLQTVAGTVYYMIVDGFNAIALGGGISNGEFCVNMTNLSVINCGDGSITPGTSSLNEDLICFDSTLVVTSSGIVAPNVGDYSGTSWIISSADISGNPDPLNDPSLEATYTIQSPAPGTSTRQYTNDVTGILPPGVHYWTPVVFGNATAVAPPPTFLSDLVLDPTCTYTGQSLMVTLLAQGDPCTVGINEPIVKDFGISNLYPVPVVDKVNFILNMKDKGTVTVSVKDNIGQEVVSKQITTAVGENDITLDMAKQSPGVYFITVTSNKSTVVSKFVKQ